jgi:hypothetical protein
MTALLRTSDQRVERPSEKTCGKRKERGRRVFSQRSERGKEREGLRSRIKDRER